MSKYEITAEASRVSDEVKKLANRLATSLHCTPKVTKESSGYHIYVPCPDCLPTHKRAEINDPKLAINATKYFAQTERYAYLRDIPGSGIPNIQLNRDRRSARGKCVVCMRSLGAGNSKNLHMYDVEDLLRMPPYHEQVPDLNITAGRITDIQNKERESYWVEDPETGVKCPPPPGQVTPITSLPVDHPARVYLETRGYDITTLWDQFRCSYCFAENPESQEGRIWYPKMYGGWKDTPQGRIIFYTLNGGVPWSWQARYIDCLSRDGNSKYALNPYSSQWDHTHIKSAMGSAWMACNGFESVFPTGHTKAGKKMWNPSKYKTATHSEKAKHLMGWDAAVKFNTTRDLKFCVLCEGPLDAGRVGPPGLAVLGKTVSQAVIPDIVTNFHVVITAFDNDTAGRGATASTIKSLEGAADTRHSLLESVVPITIPTKYKDIGDMPQEEFNHLLNRTLKVINRKLNL